jgi:hypothetical protein
MMKQEQHNLIYVKTMVKMFMLFVLFSLFQLNMNAAAQKEKPWTEWTKKDVEKMLNDSAWGQTQIDTDTSEMTWSTAPRPIDGKGAVNQATSVNYYIRFVSAKPIRQAYARLAELGGLVEFGVGVEFGEVDGHLDRLAERAAALAHEAAEEPGEDAFAQIAFDQAGVEAEGQAAAVGHGRAREDAGRPDDGKDGD